MAQYFAPTSTKALAPRKARDVAKELTSAAKFFAPADHVAALLTTPPTVAVPDGAPMLKRWHHLEVITTAF